MPEESESYDSELVKHRCPQCGKTARGGSEIERFFGFRKMGSSLKVQSWCINCRSKKTNSELEEPSLEYSQTKKETPVYKLVDSARKTYSELLEFIEEGMMLKANYQLVMLNYLVLHKVAHIGQMAEELALFNNADATNIEEIKKFFDVPVYEVLEKRGFVTTSTPYDITHYVLNVDLSQYQEMHVHEVLQKKLEEYNKEHGIPYEPYPYSPGIDWDGYKELLWRRSKAQKTEQKIWIWSVTPQNWEILQKNNVWGSKIPREKIREKIHDNDLVVFYVIGTNSFKGICKFVGDWYKAKTPIWADEKDDLIYKSKIVIKPEKLGDAPISELADKLEIFKGKDMRLVFLTLKCTGGYPSNGGKPISINDYEIIRNEL